MRLVLAVFAGGVLGTLLRLSIDLALPVEGFPLSTLLVNVSGAFALGLLVSRVWPRASAATKAFLGTGLLGSFTTFSAFAAALVSADSLLVAAASLVATLLLGFGAAWAGLRIGRVER